MAILYCKDIMPGKMLAFYGNVSMKEESPDPTRHHPRNCPTLWQIDKYRPTLFGNVVLSGGNSIIQDYNDS